MSRLSKASALLIAMLLIMMGATSYPASAADGDIPEGPGIPPEGWSREELLCEYSRLTGAFSADISGNTVLIAYSDGEYDWLRIALKAYELTERGPKLLWQKDISTQRTHNIAPSVLQSATGGFHVLWVERPNQDDYGIRYAKLSQSGQILIEDTLLETGSGPIRDLTAVELDDGSIALAWSDWRGRTLEIIVGRIILTDGAARLTGHGYLEKKNPEKAISTPRMAYDRQAGHLALVWVESGFEEANLLLTWLSPDTLQETGFNELGSFTTASGGYPAIQAGREGQIFVSWPQDINIRSFTAIRTSDIMLAEFRHKQLVYMAKIVDLPGDQTAPALAYDGQNIFVAWHDFTDRSPHIWAFRPEAEDKAIRIDYSLMAAMKPVALMTPEGKAVLIYERFTSEGPRQAYLMSQVNPAEITALYIMGIDEAAPVRHVAFTMALSLLNSAMNVMVNIGALALGMAFLWALKKTGLKDAMRNKPELMAASIILFLMVLQATPLFVALPKIFGADFHLIVSIAAGFAAFMLMRIARSEWWLDSLMQLVFMCVWLFFQQYALLIPSILKVGLR